MIGDPENDATRRLQDMGERIAQLRRQAGLTRLDLSRLSGLTLGFIDAVENGLVQLPSPVLLTLCRVLHVDLLAVFSFGGQSGQLMCRTGAETKAGRSHHFRNTSGTSYDIAPRDEDNVDGRHLLN